MDSDFIDWINDPANHVMQHTPQVVGPGYTTIVLDDADYDRMMKHFDPKYMTETERRTAIDRIIFKKADQIAALEGALIEAANTIESLHKEYRTRK
jgi:hypothetical protein